MVWWLNQCPTVIETCVLPDRDLRTKIWAHTRSLHCRSSKDEGSLAPEKTAERCKEGLGTTSSLPLVVSTLAQCLGARAIQQTSRVGLARFELRRQGPPSRLEGKANTPMQHLAMHSVGQIQPGGASPKACLIVQNPLECAGKPLFSRYALRDVGLQREAHRRGNKRHVVHLTHSNQFPHRAAPL